ncbi:MAG TPA: hypothetical protein VHV08_05440, partial [Pirellulales bacterium]|nr:hypothetical protein [Pirellulales bacterium]
ALRAKQREEYSAYMARIGMAAAKVDENAFDAAEGLLAACQPPDRADNLRNWEWGYLHRLCGQGIKYEAQGTIASVAFARNGGWFVTAGEDGQAHLFNVGSSHQRAAISHGDYIHAVAVSPDGRLVATAGGDGLVRLSNADDGKFVRTLAGHTDRVLGVAFSPVDGRWLLTCSRDKTARLWDTATGKELAGSPLVGHSWWVWSAAFSPDERHLATAGQDGKVIIWSFDPAGSQKIEQQKVFLGHDGPVFAVAFSPDGKQVVSAGYDKRVLAWIPEKIQDIALKQLVADVPMVPQESRSFEGHSAPVRAVSFSADGHYVLSGGDDNTLRIWDIRSGKQHALLRGHSRPIQSCAFSPRGGLVLSGGQEGQIKLWKILADSRAVAPEGRVLEGHEDAILSATFSRDGRRIATASRDHTARIYDARSGQSLCQLKEGHEFLASRAMFFNRGRRLLTASGDNTMRIWDAATGLEQSSLEGTGRAAAVAVSHDSKWILTGRTETNTRRGPADGTEGDDASQPRITLWDLDAEAKLPQPHVFSKGQFGIGHRSIVTAVAISPDRRWLFSGDEAGTGKLWDAVEGTEFHTLKGHTAAITDAAFSPDSRRLFTSSNDGTVAHWDVTSGKELPLVFSHADPERRHAYDAPITAMALSPDGRQLLSLSEGSQGTTRESVIRLWDVGQGKLVHELYRGPENITSVAFADSAREAVAASSPRSSEITAEKEIASAVRRWDLATGREIHGPEGKPFLDFKGSPEVIWAALDVPGGARVLTIGGKGAAIWDPNNPRQPDLVFKPHTGVTSASFSPDGRFVVTGSSDHRAKIWNAETGRGELQLPPEHSKPITSAAYSPTDANLLLTASSDGTARLWQLPTRRVLRVFKHDPSQTRTVSVRCAIFSPDGNHILTAGADRAVRIWNAGTGQLVGTITLDASALAAAYSVDGRRILLGLSSGKAILFDAASRRPLVRYSGHTGAINSVALSPDGRRALTGSNDRSAKIWDTDREHSGAASGQASATAAASIDVKDGTDILTLKHHDQPVTSVAFSPDGHSVLTAGLDGTAVVWLADNWDEKPAPP